EGSPDTPRTRRRRCCSALASRRRSRTASWSTTTSTRDGGRGVARSAPRRESSCPPREQEGLHRLRRRLQLVALDGSRGVHVLGAHPRALADECAAPDALVLDEHVETLPRPSIARVEVVSLG